MSLSLIRPYFDTKLKSLGLKEHRDAFNNENIPSTVLDKSYHFSITDYRNNSRSNTGQEIIVSVRIEYVLKGYRDTVEGYDRSSKLASDILLAIMSLSDRLNIQGIKNITFDSGSFEAFDTSNDNIIRGVQNYSVYLYYCF